MKPIPFIIPDAQTVKQIEQMVVSQPFLKWVELLETLAASHQELARAAAIKDPLRILQQRSIGDGAMDHYVKAAQMELVLSAFKKYSEPQILIEAITETKTKA